MCVCVCMCGHILKSLIMQIFSFFFLNNTQEFPPTALGRRSPKCVKYLRIWRGLWNLFSVMERFLKLQGLFSKHPCLKETVHRKGLTFCQKGPVKFMTAASLQTPRHSQTLVATPPYVLLVQGVTFDIMQYGLIDLFLTPKTSLTLVICGKN